MTTRLETTLTAFRAAKRSCALLMMDLDKFKHVNDSLGHPAGDELLRQVAQRLQKIVPEPAEIGRLGGDEFQIIIPDIDDRGRLGDLAGQIIKMLSQPYSLNGDRAAIGASVGIAIAPYDGVSMDELVESADLALYAAKGGGRGQYRFYGVELASAAARQREIGEELRHAADRAISRGGERSAAGRRRRTGTGDRCDADSAARPGEAAASTATHPAAERAPKILYMGFLAELHLAQSRLRCI